MSSFSREVPRCPALPPLPIWTTHPTKPVTDTKSRTQLVTLRLSKAEHDSLRSICEEKGARSLSEFAREAVLGRIQTLTRTSVSLGDDLTTLGMHLQDLDAALRELREHIARVLGARTGEQGAQDSKSNARGAS